ncbi:hypothetical protein BDR26DRAFT_92933 [Obelidium mucronatum]|nr:hypothetical protein BDR26DRAFT_92933 [Obelidium mucronatum]
MNDQEDLTRTTDNPPQTHPIHHILKNNSHQTPATSTPQNPVFDPSKSNWLKDQIAFTLPSILTSSECSSWITESESLGFIKATVLKQGNAVVNEDFRKSGRCIIDSSLLAEALWDRIREHIPSVILNSSEPDCIYRPVGINERFRVLKYEPGDSFKRHRDFSFRRDDGSEVSMLTVQLYLNNCEEGGETLFGRMRSRRRFL